MRWSRKGFGLAEVIVSFVIMVILIGVMATAIQFSQKLLQQAENLRNRTDEIAKAFTQPDTGLIDTNEERTLTFSDGTLTFIVPVSVQERQIILSEDEILTFRVFATPIP